MTLTCPECDEELRIDEEWQLVDLSLVGTRTTDIQGDYVHKRCYDE